MQHTLENPLGIHRNLKRVSRDRNAANDHDKDVVWIDYETIASNSTQDNLNPNGVLNDNGNKNEKDYVEVLYEEGIITTQNGFTPHDFNLLHKRSSNDKRNHKYHRHDRTETKVIIAKTLDDQDYEDDMISNATYDENFERPPTSTLTRSKNICATKPNTTVESASSNRYHKDDHTGLKKDFDTFVKDAHRQTPSDVAKSNKASQVLHAQYQTINNSGEEFNPTEDIGNNVEFGADFKDGDTKFWKSKSSRVDRNTRASSTIVQIRKSCHTSSMPTIRKTTKRGENVAVQASSEEDQCSCETTTKRKQGNGFTEGSSDDNNFVGDVQKGKSSNTQTVSNLSNHRKATTIFRSYSRDEEDTFVVGKMHSYANVPSRYLQSTSTIPSHTSIKSNHIHLFGKETTTAKCELNAWFTKEVDVKKGPHMHTTSAASAAKTKMLALPSTKKSRIVRMADQQIRGVSECNGQTTTVGHFSKFSGTNTCNCICLPTLPKCFRGKCHHHKHHLTTPKSRCSISTHAIEKTSRKCLTTKKLTKCFTTTPSNMCSPTTRKCLTTKKLRKCFTTTPSSKCSPTARKCLRRKKLRKCFTTTPSSKCSPTTGTSLTTSGNCATKKKPATTSNCSTTKSCVPTPKKCLGEQDQYSLFGRTTKDPYMFRSSPESSNLGIGNAGGGINPGSDIGKSNNIFASSGSKDKLDESMDEMVRKTKKLYIPVTSHDIDLSWNFPKELISSENSTSLPAPSAVSNTQPQSDFGMRQSPTLASQSVTNMDNHSLPAPTDTSNCIPSTKDTVKYSSISSPTATSTPGVPNVQFVLLLNDGKKPKKAFAKITKCGFKPVNATNINQSRSRRNFKCSDEVATTQVPETNQGKCLVLDSEFIFPSATTNCPVSSTSKYEAIMIPVIYQIPRQSCPKLKNRCLGSTANQCTQCMQQYPTKKPIGSLAIELRDEAIVADTLPVIDLTMKPSTSECEDELVLGLGDEDNDRVVPESQNNKRKIHNEYNKRSAGSESLILNGENCMRQTTAAPIILPIFRSHTKHTNCTLPTVHRHCTKRQPCKHTLHVCPTKSMRRTTQCMPITPKTTIHKCTKSSVCSPKTTKCIPSTTKCKPETTLHKCTVRTPCIHRTTKFIPKTTLHKCTVGTPSTHRTTKCTPPITKCTRRTTKFISRTTKSLVKPTKCYCPIIKTHKPSKSVQCLTKGTRCVRSTAKCLRSTSKCDSSLRTTKTTKHNLRTCTLTAGTTKLNTAMCSKSTKHCTSNSLSHTSERTSTSKSSATVPSSHGATECNSSPSISGSTVHRNTFSNTADSLMSTNNCHPPSTPSTCTEMSTVSNAIVCPSINRNFMKYKKKNKSKYTGLKSKTKNYGTGGIGTFCMPNLIVQYNSTPSEYHNTLPSISPDIDYEKHVAVLPHLLPCQTTTCKPTNNKMHEVVPDLPLNKAGIDTSSSNGASCGNIIAPNVILVPVILSTIAPVNSFNRVLTACRHGSIKRRCRIKCKTTKRSKCTTSSIRKCTNSSTNKCTTPRSTTTTTFCPSSSSTSSTTSTQCTPTSENIVETITKNVCAIRPTPTLDELLNNLRVMEALGTNKCATKSDMQEMTDMRNRMRLNPSDRELTISSNCAAASTTQAHCENVVKSRRRRRSKRTVVTSKCKCTTGEDEIHENVLESSGYQKRERRNTTSTGTTMDDHASLSKTPTSTEVDFFYQDFENLLDVLKSNISLKSIRKNIANLYPHYAEFTTLKSATPRAKITPDGAFKYESQVKKLIPNWDQGEEDATPFFETSNTTTTTLPFTNTYEKSTTDEYENQLLDLGPIVVTHIFPITDSLLTDSPEADNTSKLLAELHGNTSSTESNKVVMFNLQQGLKFNSTHEIDRNIKAVYQIISEAGLFTNKFEHEVFTEDDLNTPSKFDMKRKAATEPTTKRSTQGLNIFFVRENDESTNRSLDLNVSHKTTTVKNSFENNGRNEHDKYLVVALKTPNRTLYEQLYVYKNLTNTEFKSFRNALYEKPSKFSTVRSTYSSAVYPDLHKTVESYEGGRSIKKRSVPNEFPETHLKLNKDVKIPRGSKYLNISVKAPNGRVVSTVYDSKNFTNEVFHQYKNMIKCSKRKWRKHPTKKMKMHMAVYEEEATRMLPVLGAAGGTKNLEELKRYFATETTPDNSEFSQVLELCKERVTIDFPTTPLCATVFPNKSTVSADEVDVSWEEVDDSVHLPNNVKNNQTDYNELMTLSAGETEPTFNFTLLPDLERKPMTKVPSNVSLFQEPDYTYPFEKMLQSKPSSSTVAVPTCSTTSCSTSTELDYLKNLTQEISSNALTLPPCTTKCPKMATIDFSDIDATHDAGLDPFGFILNMLLLQSKADMTSTHSYKRTTCNNIVQDLGLNEDLQRDAVFRPSTFLGSDGTTETATTATATTANVTRNRFSLFHKMKSNCTLNKSSSNVLLNTSITLSTCTQPLSTCTNSARLQFNGASTRKHADILNVGDVWNSPKELRFDEMKRDVTMVPQTSRIHPTNIASIGDGGQDFSSRVVTPKIDDGYSVSCTTNQRPNKNESGALKLKVTTSRFDTSSISRPSKMPGVTNSSVRGTTVFGKLEGSTISVTKPVGTASSNRTYTTPAYSITSTLSPKTQPRLPICAPRPYTKCNGKDYDGGNHCFCCTDTLIKDMRLKLEEKKGDKIFERYTCPELHKMSKGIILADGRSTRLRREVINSINIDRILDEDFNMRETSESYYGLLGGEVRIRCINGDCGEVPPSKLFVWKFNDVVISRGETNQDGTLALHALAGSDSGKYTCVMSDLDEEVKARSFDYKLWIISISSYTLKLNIAYKMNMKCNPNSINAFRQSFTDALTNIICGEDRRVCNVEISNAHCLTSDQPLFALTILVPMLPLKVIFPSIDKFNCDQFCQMRINAKLTRFIYKNLINVATTPVFYKPTGEQQSDLIPVSFEEPMNRFSLFVTCPPGFGYIKDTHICGACETNMYSRGNATRCTPCPKDHYQNMMGSRSCLACNSIFQDPYCFGNWYSYINLVEICVISLLFLILISVIMCCWLRNFWQKKDNGKDARKESIRKQSKGTVTVEEMEEGMWPLPEEKGTPFQSSLNPPEPPPPDFI